MRQFHTAFCLFFVLMHLTPVAFGMGKKKSSAPAPALSQGSFLSKVMTNGRVGAYSHSDPAGRAGNRQEEPEDKNENKSPYAVSNGTNGTGEITDPKGRGTGASITNPNNNNNVTAVTQNSAQIKASQLSGMAGGQETSIGTASCAEGANQISTNKAAAGTLFKSCVKSFDSANQLKEMELATAGNGNIQASEKLAADKALLEHANAEAIFEELNKKYGTDKDHFREKLLEAKGNPDILSDQATLDDLFGGKISRDQVLDAVGVADGLSAEESEKILAESRIADLKAEAAENLAKFKGTAASASRLAKNEDLRNALRERLSKVDAAGGDKNIADRKPAAATAASTTPLYANLQPLENPPFAALDEQTSEPEGGLSLFEVVHNKYVEKQPALFGRP